MELTVECVQPFRGWRPVSPQSSRDPLDSQPSNETKSIRKGKGGGKLVFSELYQILREIVWTHSRILTWVIARIAPVYGASSIILIVNIDAYATKFANTGLSCEMSSTTVFMIPKCCMKASTISREISDFMEFWICNKL